MQDDPLAIGLATSLEDMNGDLAAGVMTELQRGWQMHHVTARMRQARIAEATQRIEHAAIQGVGEMKMRIDPHAYHYWGQRLGYDCWHDKAFRDEYARDNPEVRVINRARRETILKTRELGARNGKGIRIQDSGSGDSKPKSVVLTTKRGSILP